MAITLTKNTRIDLGSLVENAVSTVSAVRRTEQTRKEAEFQKAIAEGNMSYDAQLEFRNKQIEDEKASPISDSSYLATLESSVTTLKKLNRFNKYRTKYAEALADMNSGQINAVEYKNQLEKLLGSTTDPELRLEIQGNITNAENQVTEYKNTILSNQVKRAQYDGTQKTIKDTIKAVEKARTLAALGDNEDEVTEYDATLAALNSQLVQVRVEDTVNDLTVAGSIGTFNSKGKLDSLTSKLEDADSSVPVVIGGKRFASEKQYWTITRNAYLSGAGSGIFSDYFGEVENQYKERMEGEAAKYGFVPANTIETMRAELEYLKTKPEFQPFLERLDTLQSKAVGTAIGSMAKTIVDRAEYSGDFAKADAALKSLGQTYGIDTSGYQLDLGNKLNSQVNASIAAGQGTPPEAALLPGSEFPIPNTKPTAPVTPFKNPITPVAPTNVAPPAPAISNVAPPTVTPPVKTGYTGGSIRDFLSSQGKDSSVTARAKLALEQGLVKTEKEYLDLAATGQNASINTSLLTKLRGM